MHGENGNTKEMLRENCSSFAIKISCCSKRLVSKEGAEESNVRYGYK